MKESIYVKVNRMSRQSMVKLIWFTFMLGFWIGMTNYFGLLIYNPISFAGFSIMAMLIGWLPIGIFELRKEKMM